MHHIHKHNTLECNHSARGVGIVEYMTVIALIIFAVFATLYFFGSSSSEKFDTVGSAINGNTTAGALLEENITEELSECGNNICNTESETCKTCPADCKCLQLPCENALPCLPCFRLQADCSCIQDDNAGGCIKLGEVCVNGTCTNSDPCLGVICEACHACEDGDCIVANGAGGCPNDDICIYGECSKRRTCPHACPPCMSCNANLGECEINDALNNCGPCLSCENGICVNDPSNNCPMSCDNFDCGPCSRCEGGACTADDAVGGCEEGMACVGGTCSDVS